MYYFPMTTTFLLCQCAIVWYSFEWKTREKKVELEDKERGKKRRVCLDSNFLENDKNDKQKKNY